MLREGQIVLFEFPNADQRRGKLRPALIIKPCPGQYGDWLICMISSQLHQQLPGIDEVLTNASSDFSQTGLKLSSVIRITRLAVVKGDIIKGSIGSISSDRHKLICTRLSEWLSA
jgi:mRNA interferase MazF